MLQLNMFYVALKGHKITCSSKVSNRGEFSVKVMEWIVSHISSPFSNRGRYSQWIGSPLLDWVHTERSAVEGLPQRALFWWVHTHLKGQSLQAWRRAALLAMAMLHHSERLHVAHCPLLVCGVFYLMLATGDWWLINTHVSSSIACSSGWNVLSIFDHFHRLHSQINKRVISLMIV